MLTRVVGGAIAGTRPELVDVARLFGVAHVPVLTAAIAAQTFGVLLDVGGPGRAVTGFSAAIWMPGQLVGAARHLFGVDSRVAAAIVAGPYLIWLAAVGVQLMRQVGHLL